MSNQYYSAEFKEEAIRQITVRENSVKKISVLPSVSYNSLYKIGRIRYR